MKKTLLLALLVPFVSLADTYSTALDISDLTFTTGGSASWYVTSGTSYSGSTSMRSGTIGHSQSTWMQTTVVGPATVSFYWKVSSESVSYDWLEFDIDGLQQAKIGGTGSSWSQKTYTLSSGSHTLKWFYRKDGSQVGGSDCGWVDKLVISRTISFNLNGGSGSVSSITRNMGQPFGSLPTPATRSGYAFDGWFTAATGGTQVTSTTTVNSQTTLYAHWQPLVSFAEALDIGAGGLTFTTGGDANWYVQSSTVYSGSTAMRSGAIGDYGNTWMQTTVEGPATVSFNWKVSSESVNYDWLEFDIDGTQQNKIGGTGDSYWEQKSYTLSSGSHTLKWLYRKDSSQYSGSDCGWVDKLVVSRTISFNLNGGSGSVSSISRNMGQTFGSLPTPATRSGYAFDGWFTAATGGTQVTSETIVMTQTTLYAHWHSLSSEVAMAMNASGREFTMGGSANWRAGSNAGAGSAFVRSGEIGNSQETWLETTVEGRKLVTFEWKSSSEQGYDYLRLLVDGQPVVDISGIMTGWETVSNVVADGTHTLRWVYLKDGGTVGGDDCGYVRNLQFIELPDNVFFDGNGGVAELEADYREAGTPFGELPEAEREGYDFAGWFLADGTEVTDATIMPEGEVTLYARWEATQGLYDSEWTAEGTLDITSGVRQVRNAIALTYDSSWAENGASVLLTTNGSDFAAAAGAGAQAWSGGHSGTYALAHQVLNANGDSVGDPLTASVLWITQSAVSFNLNGGTGELDPQTFDNGLGYGTLPTIAANARPGYMPVGWFTAPQGGTQVTAATVASEEVPQLYVQWTANAYTVEFDANGGEGEMGPQAFTYDVAANLSSNAFARVGYGFAGWSLDADGEVDFADGEEVSNLTTEADGTVTLYAVWQGNPYTVRFDANGGEGEEMEPYAAVYGEEDVLPDNAYAIAGYMPVGWSLTPTGDVAVAEGGCFSNLTVVAGGEVTLYAQWAPNEYSVCFYANGGDGWMDDEPFVYFEERELAANEFYRCGYVFAGWTGEDGRTFADGELVSNLTTRVRGVYELSAVWTPVSYAIRFDANGGSGEMADLPMTYDEVSALSSNGFSRVGYSFVGWTTEDAEGDVVFCDGEDVENLVNVQDGSITLYAVWQPNEYCVRYDANGGFGSMCDQWFVFDEIQYLQANAFSRYGCTFIGWSREPNGAAQFADGELVENLTVEPDAEVVLYAVWNPTVYAISYDLAGGVNAPGNPTQYTVFDLPLVLEPPTRAYSEFDHWEPSGEIPAETTGDLSFTAVWKTLHLNGMVIEGQSLTKWEDGGDPNVVIPSFVTEIADGAFKGCYKIKSVTLPDGLERIGDEAFSACTGLKQIVIPDTVREVGDGAFLNCTMLAEIQLPGSVERIGSDAFRNCSSLLSVDLPEGLQSIGDSAFYDCWSLMFVSLPLSLEEIGEDVFGGCDNINGVSVPTHLVTLADLFPDQYNQIETASVPEGELQIKEGMFMGCTSLKSVSWPESIVVIGQYAFANCTGFGDINIPDGVRGIGEYAFYGCSRLVNIALPQTLEIVESHAFAGCGSMRTITMPENVSALGSCLFPSSVVSVNFLGDAPTANADLYQGASSQLTTYVLRGTTGWDGIPGSQQLPRENWYGRPIAYLQADEFDVTFDGNGGSPALQVVGQQTQQGYVLPLEQPKRTGYVFAGWWTSRELGGQVTVNTKVTVTHPHTLYAHWAEKANTVEIRFNANGGTVNPDVRMYGGSLTYGDFPVATRTGYRFLGWYTMATGGERVTEAMPVPSAPTTLFAHWTENTYSVVFHSNREGEEFVNGEYTGATYQQMLRWSETANLYKNRFAWGEHNFTGWANPDNGEVAYYDGEPVNRLTQVYGASVHLFATWSGANYAVRFNGNGGSGHMDDQQFTAGIRSALAPNEYSRDGYVFKGWATTEARAASGTVDYLDRQRILDGAEINGVYVLFAVWQPESSSLVDVYLQYNDGGDGSMTAVLSSNGALGALPVPERMDYVFTGWHEATEDGAVVGDRTSVQSLIEQTRRQLYAAVAPDGSRKLLSADNPVGRRSATLVAGWQYVGSAVTEGHMVTFDANGGTVAETVRIVVKGDALGALPTPMREGFTFLDWYTAAEGGTKVSAETIVDGDVTFFAHWKKIPVAGVLEPLYPSDGEFLAVAANVYDGVAVDAGGNLVGVVQVKTAKQSVKTKTDKKTKVKTVTTNITATATVTDANGKKWSYSKGVVTVDGVVSGLKCTAKGCPVEEFGVTLGRNGLEGEWSEYAIFGARNGMGTKGDAMKETLEAYKGKWSVTVGSTGETPPSQVVRLQLNVQAKGVVKIAGNWENGVKVSASAQMIMGDGFAYVPVMVKSTKTSPALNALLRIDAGDEIVLLGEGELVNGGRTTAAIEILDYLAENPVKAGAAYVGRVALNELAYPAKFTQKGLPTGLKINAATGVVSGTPTKPGEYEVTFTAASSMNSKSKDTVKVTIKVDNYVDWLIPVEDHYGPYTPGESYTETISEAAGCTVSGLPTGMKWTAKDIKAKDGTVKTPANSVYGIPTKPGKYTVYFKKKVSELNEKGKWVKVTHTATATFEISGYPTITILPSLAIAGSEPMPLAEGAELSVSVGVKQFFAIDLAGTLDGVATTVSAKGLPAGLKLVKKAVYVDPSANKKVVDHYEYVIEGVPTKASSIDKKTKNVVPSHVKLTASNKYKWSGTFEFDIMVEALPTWAYGTFDGGSTDGMATLSVSKVGKLSGKWMSDGLTWTLSAASYAAYYPDEEKYVATVQAKCGREAKTIEVEVTQEGVTGLLAPVLEDLDSTVLFEAWRNGWKEDPLKTLAKNLKGQKEQVGEVEVLLTVGANGAVTAKGSFVTGFDEKKQKDVIYSATCSTVLIPTEEDGWYKVYLYFPPKSGKFDGFSACESVMFAL